MSHFFDDLYEQFISNYAPYITVEQRPYSPRYPMHRHLRLDKPTYTVPQSIDDTAFEIITAPNQLHITHGDHQFSFGAPRTRYAQEFPVDYFMSFHPGFAYHSMERSVDREGFITYLTTRCKLINGHPSDLDNNEAFVTACYAIVHAANDFFFHQARDGINATHALVMEHGVCRNIPSVPVIYLDALSNRQGPVDDEQIEALLTTYADLRRYGAHEDYVEECKALITQYGSQAHNQQLIAIDHVLDRHDEQHARVPIPDDDLIIINDDIIETIPADMQLIDLDILHSEQTTAREVYDLYVRLVTAKPHLIPALPFKGAELRAYISDHGDHMMKNVWLPELIEFNQNPSVVKTQDAQYQRHLAQQQGYTL